MVSQPPSCSIHLQKRFDATARVAHSHRAVRNVTREGKLRTRALDALKLDQIQFGEAADAHGVLAFTVFTRRIVGEHVVN